ncbi:putative membrane protein-like [Iris pallida]|uniref:Membrane protein-like n=1 Tax=Iris pallida TaxID=29817 RepID=A0AAX6F137_IRIPA|nr:putative membrane protein-like [Iris pallida]
MATEKNSKTLTMASVVLLLLLLLSPLSLSSIEKEEEEESSSSSLVSPSLLDRQEAQIKRLEALVESLSKSVSALESVVGSRSAAQSLVSVQSQPSISAAAAKPPLWSEKFRLSATARIDSAATCAAALPYADPGGSARYFAVGDSAGKIHVFSSTGDPVIVVPAVSDSEVTAILAYLSPSPSRRNESFLFSGHADGSVAAHRISESDGGEGWTALGLVGSRPFVSGSRDLDSPPVAVLELHQVGRTRYVVAADGAGRIRVFTENAGTLYGTVIASSRPLAFMRQRLLFLTEAGAGSLDLRSMTVKETECEGLNGSLAKSYTFDGSERSKAYGFTAEGDLIHVVLLGDAGTLKCRVRSIRKSEIDGNPVSIQTIKGYLFAVTQEKVFVYNISSQYYGRVGAPRPLFSSTLQEIKPELSNSDAVMDGSSLTKPLIATDREKLVILGLGSRYIGIYRSNFPVYKLESNAVVWSVPVLLFLLFLIGIWQFYVKKKDSLGWTPEESFNTSTTASGSILGPGPSERAYADGSRTGDMRELRGGLRGPTRRYVSPPSRYPGGPGIAFRPTSSDSGFRGTADLKFRGANLETPPGFPSRREPLFPNTQVVEDHAD